VEKGLVPEGLLETLVPETTVVPLALGYGVENKGTGEVGIGQTVLSPEGGFNELVYVEMPDDRAEPEGRASIELEYPVPAVPEPPDVGPAVPFDTG
jgi:hypothetical protein